jgi:putative transposase
MDERMRFVARLMEGEKMAVLCREFDISRKTGYKIYNRYKHAGIEGLTDRSRRPYRHANRLPFQIEQLILQLKEKHASWGAQKIRDKIKLLHSSIQLPAISTVHAVLYRRGLVRNGGRPRYKAQGTPLSHAIHPNDLWCADYKGEFMLADKRYCYPLTITDTTSRYLLCCEALGTTQEMFAFAVFERVFKDFGLPLAILTDNGIPFASRSAFFGLSKLSVWWLRLGIGIERIKPGNPQQNGRHEHASDAEKGGHQAGRQKPPPTTGQVRSLHRVLQPGAASSGLARSVPRSAVSNLATPLCGLNGFGVPLSRSHRHGHHLWADLYRTA